jgi:hypothetical protein
MEVGSLDSPLRARDAEELGQGMQQRGLARGVRSDDSCDLGRKSNGDWLWAKTAKACQGDAF